MKSQTSYRSIDIDCKDSLKMYAYHDNALFCTVMMTVIPQHLLLDRTIVCRYQARHTSCEHSPLHVTGYKMQKKLRIRSSVSPGREHLIERSIPSGTRKSSPCRRLRIRYSVSPDRKVSARPSKVEPESPIGADQRSVGEFPRDKVQGKEACSESCAASDSERPSKRLKSTSSTCTKVIDETSTFIVVWTLEEMTGEIKVTTGTTYDMIRSEVANIIGVPQDSLRADARDSQHDRHAEVDTNTRIVLHLSSKD